MFGDKKHQTSPRTYLIYAAIFSVGLIVYALSAMTIAFGMRSFESDIARNNFIISMAVAVVGLVWSVLGFGVSSGLLAEEKWKICYKLAAYGVRIATVVLVYALLSGWI